MTRDAAGGPGQAESGQRKGPAAAAATRSSRRLGESEYDSDKKKARESLDAQETTLAQEFIERVKSHGYLGHQPGCDSELRPWPGTRSVVEIHPWIQRGNIAGKRRGRSECA